jgi:hypothetical protein
MNLSDFAKGLQYGPDYNSRHSTGGYVPRGAATEVTISPASAGTTVTNRSELEMAFLRRMIKMIEEEFPDELDANAIQVFEMAITEGGRLEYQLQLFIGDKHMVTSGTFLHLYDAACDLIKIIMITGLTSLIERATGKSLAGL